MEAQQTLTLLVRVRASPPQPYTGECSKAGEAVSKTAWVGSIPNRPCQGSAKPLCICVSPPYNYIYIRVQGRRVQTLRLLLYAI